MFDRFPVGSQLIKDVKLVVQWRSNGLKSGATETWGVCQPKFQFVTSTCCHRHFCGFKISFCHQKAQVRLDNFSRDDDEQSEVMSIDYQIYQISRSTVILFLITWGSCENRSQYARQMIADM